MNYVFTEEELIKYQVFEYLGVLPNLDVFLEENIIVMHKEFLKLIKKMEKEPKNERKEKFLKNITCIRARRVFRGRTCSVPVCKWWVIC